ncbi:hypothetical protein Ccrd_020248 [Cynara cardunculus var. scolymus]|uniref:Uncharacterized protein n=1 Tax=Cynara cardunculus var. scolymus TaxID=59895 RepID=A0A103Y2T0_CYNCS|nr:hypothetical protein Ccrd_020248 [Cynara cardunculus var. scolymus]
MKHQWGQPWSFFEKHFKGKQNDSNVSFSPRLSLPRRRDVGYSFTDCEIQSIRSERLQTVRLV